VSIFLLLVLSLALTAPAFAQSAIDSPLPGSVQSGTVAPPTGWHCASGAITAQVDGGPTINFTEQQNRADTATPCSNSGENAFIIAQPWNWNVLGAGAHVITFFNDGSEFAEAPFTVATFGTEFLFGPRASFVVEDFPDAGADVAVSWDPAIQNFRITQVIESDAGAFSACPCDFSAAGLAQVGIDDSGFDNCLELSPTRLQLRDAESVRAELIGSSPAPRGKECVRKSESPEFFEGHINLTTDEFDDCRMDLLSTGLCN
jgi:hypothetical protein